MGTSLLVRAVVGHHVNRSHEGHVERPVVGERGWLRPVQVDVLDATSFRGLERGKQLLAHRSLGSSGRSA